MDKSSKKLMTYAIILLVVPFVAFMSTKPHDVAADSPTISIIDVTTTTDYKIDVTVEVSLPDYTYTHYTKFVRLYLNQSASTIIANSYDSYNSTLTYDRQTEVTFEDNIFSPSLSNGSTLDSAYYNVSVVAISNLDEYSSVVEWAGGLIYIDTELPEIVWITPTVSFEEIWGLYTVEVNLTDISNISQVKFIVDTKERYRISESDITEGQIYFNWTWDCSNDAPGQHILSVEAKDNSSAQNTNDWSWTVDRKGPVLSYVDSIPSYIDSNDTLALNVSVTDPDFDVDYV
ncbi:MAG: Ig-like domain-containing protein, partial [Candidatus Heimdallarchaeota archaeon]